MKLEPELEKYHGEAMFVLRCPNCEVSLIAWQILAGRRLGVGFGKGTTWAQEKVGYPYDSENVGTPLPGQAPHFRYSIWCNGCHFRKPLTPTTVDRVIYPLIEGLARQGGGKWIENDIDRLLRRLPPPVDE